MNLNERIDRLEEKLNYLDKKVLVIIIVFVIVFLGLNSNSGALSGILVGFSTLEVTNTMEPILIFALVAFLGTLFRGYLGYLKVKGEVPFDFQMLLISAVPTISAALGSAAFLDIPVSAANLVLVFFGAAGINSLQDKFGLQKKH